MTSVDINCDLGEGETAEDCARDARIMPFISRCNIACGGHAGNATTMALSLQNARATGIAAGAHPGYPDKENFGRRSLSMPRQDLLCSVREQILALQTIAEHERVTLSHIKLHGALYNDAEADEELAEDLVQLIAREFSNLQILALANAAMERVAKKYRHPVLREGFMDRRYLNDHQLAPRSMPGSVMSSFDECLAQVLALSTGQPFLSIEKKPLQFSVDSICLHGDNPRAESIAQDLQQELLRAGIRLCQ
ncbi:5-oxoprolinase subunit PxpA [Microbulbifer sp. CAU 1566]|uniref:5-oxoprolinase subunit PxpA n=1 Tax=Microbulbifer sp. CAU 1566 TaxID=2933269 RepID=UPI002006D062|nr:5-oxoprolinase subunit PxpA [Microbulbifer sp. CAU 1566]MCK7598753.1 5-oxoprolinase subunit PxpA [Microbulbifer sp. CAU 1566]